MINIENVFFSYNSNKPVLKGINLHVGENEIVGLLGSNGSGKTTTLKLLTGLLSPTEGDIKICGKSLQNNKKESHKIVAYVPDETLLYPNFSALENMNLFSILWGTEKNIAKSRTEKLLKEVGLWEVRNQWVNAYVSNEGIVQGDGAKILRYRSMLQARDIAIFADVHVKHGAHAIVADRPVEEQARDVEFFDADVAIATGNHTGDATPIEEIENIRRGTSLPVIIGSGLSVGNAFDLMGKADGAIVGSSLKENGEWWGRVSVNRVRALVREVSRLRP